MSALIYFLYSYFLSPAVYILLKLLRPVLPAKLSELTQDKESRSYTLQGSLSKNDIAQASPIWIHAASGEIEYARPVIRELKKRFPRVPILVTYSSPSAKKILAQLSEVDAWCAVPWDLPPHIQKFLDEWNPRMVLFARTDVWPTLAHVTRSRKLPMILFSATFAENSSRISGLSGMLNKYALDQLSEIHCVGEEDIKNLHSLNLKAPLIASGDTRFDQVFHRLENPKVLKTELLPSPEDFIFIAGSTWSQDEAVLVPALKDLTADIRVMIAPHETTEQHLQDLEKSILDHGLRSQRYSTSSVWSSPQILIVDQVGILAELYTWADVAFVGGSFKKQVHSVMEPLAAGLPVIVGPHFKNNREALLYQRKHTQLGPVVQVIQTSKDLSILLSRIKNKQNTLTQVKIDIKNEVQQNKNSTLRVIEALSKF